MDEKLTDELIESILSPLEAAEARSLALVRALIETGLLREDQLQPFLDQADSAAEIKGRGLRIRMKRVIADIAKQADNARKEEEAKKTEGKDSKRAEGPQQDPEEEAREHPKAAGEKEQPKKSSEPQPPREPKSAKQTQSENAKPEGTAEKKEDAA